jgi:hypothetical protein
VKWLAPVFGISSVSPLVLAQTSGGANADAITWMTGGTVITVVGLFYRFLTERIKKLEAQVDELTKAAERRAEEDRKLLIPLLSRSVEAQAAYLARRLDIEEE